MSSQMFISVNETFLIRDSLPNKILNKCLNFVVNHKNLDKEKILKMPTKQIFQN